MTVWAVGERVDLYDLIQCFPALNAIENHQGLLQRISPFLFFLLFIFSVLLLRISMPIEPIEFSILFLVFLRAKWKEKKLKREKKPTNENYHMKTLAQ